MGERSREEMEARDQVEAETTRKGWEETKLRASLAGARSARDQAREERDRLRAAVEDAVAVLSAEEMDYDEWTRVLGVMRAALDGTLTPRMTDKEVESLAERVAALPEERKVDFLLGMLEKVDAERDRLRADLAVERQNRKAVEGYYEAAIQVAQEAEAERNRLQAGIEQAEVHGELIVRMRESIWREFEAERDRLRAVVEADRRFLELDPQPMDAPAVMTAWNAYVEAHRLLDGYAVPDGKLDGSPVIGDMTAEQAYDHYADPANQEPVGPPVRRSGGVRQPDSPVTVMDDTTPRPIEG